MLGVVLVVCELEMLEDVVDDCVALLLRVSESTNVKVEVFVGVSVKV